MIKLQFIHDDKVIAETQDNEQTDITYRHQYALGDFYQVVLPSDQHYIWVQLDSSLRPALIYLKESKWQYKIPFNLESEWPYPDGAFLGKNHYAWIRLATPDEIRQYRNLAFNSYDQHEKNDAFPHVSANAETRNKMAFWAKNAIDGVEANSHHGTYPFQAWGIDGRKDAELKLDFGRTVDVNQLVLVLRADYPHDGYWNSITIEFSNGEQKVIHPQEIAARQIFQINQKKITWLKLLNLVSPDDKKFVALTQIETWGRPSEE